VRTHVFLTVWFQRECCESLLVVTIMGHAFSSMLNLAGGQWHGSRYLGTSGDDSTLRGDDELAW
jgi:hypothetical protein